MYSSYETLDWRWNSPLQSSTSALRSYLVLLNLLIVICNINFFYKGLVYELSHVLCSAVPVVLLYLQWMSLLYTCSKPGGFIFDDNHEKYKLI